MYAIEASWLLALADHRLTLLVLVHGLLQGLLLHLRGAGRLRRARVRRACDNPFLPFLLLHPTLAAVDAVDVPADAVGVKAATHRPNPARSTPNFVERRPRREATRICGQSSADSQRGAEREGERGQEGRGEGTRGKGRGDKRREGDRGQEEGREQGTRGWKGTGDKREGDRGQEGREQGTRGKGRGDKREGDWGQEERRDGDRGQEGRGQGTRRKRTEDKREGDRGQGKRMRRKRMRGKWRMRGKGTGKEAEEDRRKWEDEMEDRG